MLTLAFRLAMVVNIVVALLLTFAGWRSATVRDWVDIGDGQYITSESGSVVLAISGLPSKVRMASAPIEVVEEYVMQERLRLRLDHPGFQGPPTVRVDEHGITIGSYLPDKTHFILPYWLPISGAWLSAVGLAMIGRRRSALDAPAGHAFD